MSLYFLTLLDKGKLILSRNHLHYYLYELFKNAYLLPVPAPWFSLCCLLVIFMLVIVTLSIVYPKNINCQ